MEFIRSRLVERHTTATEVIQEDLPINPLSHIIITLDGYNATDEATLAEILAFINNVQVTHKGTSIWDCQSEDLYGWNAYLLRSLPVLTGRLATDNYTRSLTLMVPFGRKLMDPEECFPATTKGNFKLRVDTTVPSSSMDNSTIAIDTVEILGANPGRFLKCYQQTLSAPGGTGDHDYELAIGNQILACQLRLTTVPTTSSHTFGIDYVKMLKNNVEHGIASADMMCLMGERASRVGCPDTTIAAQGLSPLNAIAWLDFDPNGDEKTAIQTDGATSVKLRLTHGVDEATVLNVLELQAA